MDRYVIVQAPSPEVLAMLVDGYMSSGYIPTGGITAVPDRGLDATRLIFIQAMYLAPKPLISEPEPDTSGWHSERF